MKYHLIIALLFIIAYSKANESFCFSYVYFECNTTTSPSCNYKATTLDCKTNYCEHHVFNNSYEGPLKQYILPKDYDNETRIDITFNYTSTDETFCISHLEKDPSCFDYSNYSVNTWQMFYMEDEDLELHFYLVIAQTNGNCSEYYNGAPTEPIDPTDPSPSPSPSEDLNLCKTISAPDENGYPDKIEFKSFRCYTNGECESTGKTHVINKGQTISAGSANNYDIGFHYTGKTVCYSYYKHEFSIVYDLYGGGHDFINNDYECISDCMDAKGLNNFGITVYKHYTQYQLTSSTSYKYSLVTPLNKGGKDDDTSSYIERSSLYHVMLTILALIVIHL